ncbi:MATE family efflux transporter [Schlegelella sp. S2-27]|uniref:Multidrug export protein MepA n=1 Tax=Caldimonas mangrovi TaxID=2944811 RepID=A0ABT0YRM7_9BURK|nr:MATE family efflux transporter [Caldimonas mangrovi]MCM5681385.1 MATE family efflux transporter [Caldimonas mangrovi]
MSSDTATVNAFTHGPLGAVFAKTALPIIFVMGMNGLLAVVDAVFLGVFVGPEALGAVTLMFPLYMLIVALATLVASGMSSLLARHLGAGRFDEARAVFAGAHGLALAIGAGFILLFLGFGRPVTLLVAGGSAPLAEMGHVYLGITVLFSPILFVLSVNSDALRNEGRAGFMALASLLVSLSNIGFNYLLIAVFHLGVAGSAYGTVMAQGLAFATILAFRLRGQTELRPSALLHHNLAMAWPRILALGAPQSLNFIGLALGSAAIIAALQWQADNTYEVTVAAYGIITRVMTFVFLPLLGLSHALQSITGNNYGAELWRRSDDCLRLGMTIAFIYCLVAEVALIGFAQPIGLLFVDDGEVVSEVAHIMPVMVAMFFAAGPLMMIASYFQAIGDAGRAAILSLSKPYLFAMPLTFAFAFAFGEEGIWMAGPAAEILLLALTAIVLGQAARREELRWGLFKATREVRP